MSIPYPVSAATNKRNAYHRTFHEGHQSSDAKHRMRRSEALQALAEATVHPQQVPSAGFWPGDSAMLRRTLDRMDS